MIDTQELMLGNYMFHYNGEIATIKAIHKAKIGVYLGDSQELEVFITDQFEPIPITEQWLRDFGFYDWENGKFSKWAGKAFWIDFKMVDGIYYESFLNDVPIRIAYVHQLQNLYFSIAQKELTINKEKVKA